MDVPSDLGKALLRPTRSGPRHYALRYACRHDGLPVPRIRQRRVDVEQPRRPSVGADEREGKGGALCCRHLPVQKAAEDQLAGSKG